MILTKAEWSVDQIDQIWGIDLISLMRGSHQSDLSIIYLNYLDHLDHLMTEVGGPKQAKYRLVPHPFVVQVSRRSEP
jgi:hypothetical protein